MSNFNDALYNALQELNKKTHADAIRVKSDDDLAELLSLTYNGIVPISNADRPEYWLEWLQMEHKDK